MKLDYISKFIDQDIDISQLRPEGSYDYLIKNRNGALTELIKDKKKLHLFLKKRACPTCGSAENTKRFTKDNLEIVECDKCSLIFVNPIFNQEKYEEIYKAKEYQEITKKLTETSHLYRRKRFGVERMNFIERYHPKQLDKTLCDVGCSTGFLLEEAQSRGWDALGLELNPSTAKFARKRGLKIQEISLQEIEGSEKFSAITLFDVLEHLIDPSLVLKKVKKLLKPNGNLFIYVPNWNSASRQFLGVENSHFIWPTHHLTYYTPGTLNNFLTKNGFSVFHWETQGLDLLDWNWYLKAKTKDETSFLEKHIEQFQFYINAAGHGKNLRMYATKKGE